MDEFFERPPRREIKHINVVPIIDMFTTVTFFLLLSTTFIAMTRLTVPPARVSTSSDPAAAPPLAPKLLLTGAPSQFFLQLSWGGKNPGETKRAVQGDATEVEAPSKEMTAEFSKTYPAEKSLQVGLGSGVPYQALISLMDGIKSTIPDLVLISYAEADQVEREKALAAQP